MAWQDIAAAACGWSTGGNARLDLAKARVAYIAAIKGGDGIQVLQGLEEIVRAFLVHRLTHGLGYRAERIQLEREYSAGRGK